MRLIQTKLVSSGQIKTQERLCRYITNGRVPINAAGQVELKLKTPWRESTTHQVMSPLEFLQRLAALGGAGAPAAITSNLVPRLAGPYAQAASESGAPATRGSCSESAIAGG
jgi:Putative transposase